MDAKELLDLFDERSNDSPPETRMVDRALLNILAECHEQQRLPELNGYFHTAFRQIDIFESGRLDMVAWCLLNSCKLFWECWEELDDR